MHFPAASKAGGVCFGFPDVCKVPAPPAPPIPTPFPNTAQVRTSTKTVAKVLIQNKDAVVVTSTPPSSTGDEPGSLLGIAKARVAGKCSFLRGSSKVKATGKAMVPHLAPTAHNDGNLPAGGTHCAPSQSKVFVHV